MNTTSYLNYLIARIDGLLHQQLAEVMQHAEFLKLRASWTGIHYLVSQANSCNNVKIKVLNVSWVELRKDLSRATNIEQCYLFDKVYNQEFGIAGGEPFGMLLGDYELDLHQFSSSYSVINLETLKAITSIAAASFAIFVVSAKAEMLGLDHFRQIARQTHLEVSLDHRNQNNWQNFRRSENARFVSIVLPRVLLNTHYEQAIKLQRSLYTAESLIWSNAVYPYAAIFLRSFSQTGWFIDALGIPNEMMVSHGGMLPQLTASAFSAGKSYATYKLLTETLITPAQEQKLNAAGFTVLSHLPHTQYASFINSPSLKLPDEGETDLPFNAEELACSVIYLLSVCRFAHYLKILGRDQMGKFTNPKECERFLQNWLNHYIASNPDITPEMKFRFPLTAGEVSVFKPAGYREQVVCVMRLCPQLRTTQANAGVILKTNLLPLT